MASPDLALKAPYKQPTRSFTGIDGSDRAWVMSDVDLRERIAEMRAEDRREIGLSPSIYARVRV